MFNQIFKTFRNFLKKKKDDDIDQDLDFFMWDTALARHSRGEFSFAVVQANRKIEDHSLLETSPHATFIGVYDGHGGAEASLFVRNNLFEHVTRIIQENGAMSEEVLRDAVAAIEQGFMDVTLQDYPTKPEIARTGSCCLVGVIWNETLYIANLGDSRAVIGYIGRTNRFNKRISFEQLTRDHHTKNEDIRQEIEQEHGTEVLVRRGHGLYIKGIMQVSRTIGDAHLKHPEFGSDPNVPQNYVPPPFNTSLLSAEPEVYTRILQPGDRFLIFASSGLWEFLTNEEAVDIVHKNPRYKIAKRLLKAAQKVAADRRRETYKQLTRAHPVRGERLVFHDDITVIVVYLDNRLSYQTRNTTPQFSYKGYADQLPGPSNLSNFEQFM